MSFIRWIWRGFKLIRTLLLISFLAISLLLNAAFFVGGQLYALASGAYEAVTERAAFARPASEGAELEDDLVQQRRVNRELRGEVVDLSEDLAAQKKLNRKLRKEANETAAKLVSVRKSRAAIKKAIEETAESVSRRSEKTASRNIAVMGGEALPWVGTAVIVGATSLELRDLCNTIKDMNALKRTFNPDQRPGEDEMTVCSMKVPTRQEIWEDIKTSPTIVWEKVKSLIPSLRDFRSLSFPSLDFGGYWDRVKSGTSAWLEAAGDGASTVIERSKAAPTQVADTGSFLWTRPFGGEAPPETK